MTKPKPLCDKDCNHCAIIGTANSRMLSKVLNDIYSEFGDRVTDILNDNCPNMTCCFDCRIDDFTHIMGCELAAPEKDDDEEDEDA
jgi:hypothetical protein